MSTQVVPFVYKGGVNLVRPFQEFPMGLLSDAINYECLPEGGYRRIKGYTLYDGRAANPVAPTGSGPIRGVWFYNNTAYCFRDNGGATAGQFFKATAGGWVLQSMPTILKFTTGNYNFVEGDVINGQTSGATATVARYGANSGSTGGGSLAGTLVLTGVTGAFQNGENIRTGATVRAVANGASATYVLPAGGSYRFWNYNFLGNASSQRMYGASGAGEAFEYDGTTLFPINQQSASEWPSIVVGHNDHLFLAFRTNGILRTSSLGAPRDYLSTTDAVDIGMADTINDMLPRVGGVLTLGCGGSTQVLYGANSTNWSRKRFADSGIRQRSMKEIGGTGVYVDTRGVQRMDQVQFFGDFQSISMSVPINPNLLPVLATLNPSCSIVSKQKDQYRVFFGKGGYYFTFNAGQMVGITRIALSHDVAVACEGLDSLGNEVLLFGDSLGNVFRMDSTNKFNGANVVASFTLAFTSQIEPTRRKHYRKFVSYINVDGQIPTLQARASFDLDDSTIPPTDLLAIVTSGNSGTQWDVGQWDTFQWAGSGDGQASVKLDGTGQNFQVSVYSSGAEDGQHTFRSGAYHYSPRRLMR